MNQQNNVCMCVCVCVGGGGGGWCGRAFVYIVIVKYFPCI